MSFRPVDARGCWTGREAIANCSLLGFLHPRPILHLFVLSNEPRTPIVPSFYVGVKLSDRSEVSGVHKVVDLKTVHPSVN